MLSSLFYSFRLLLFLFSLNYHSLHFSPSSSIFFTYCFSSLHHHPLSTTSLLHYQSFHHFSPSSLLSSTCLTSHSHFCLTSHSHFILSTSQCLTSHVHPRQVRGQHSTHLEHERQHQLSEPACITALHSERRHGGPQ